MDIEARLMENARLVDAALTELTARDDADFARLLDAERYSLFSRAKRVRPTLVLEFCRLCGGSDAAALPFAAAVEMMHTSSLIHDDLPAMDDDDLRRGKPSCHKAFDEATAILAGDGLLIESFAVISENRFVSSDAAREAAHVLARAVGNFGMVGGQMMDLLGEGKVLPEKSLYKLQAKKTGELLAASAELGVIASETADTEARRAARAYAENVGLAFQIIDDVLDVTSSAEVLGKATGSDERAEKCTFLTYHSVAEATKIAADLTNQAKAALDGMKNTEVLLDLADFLAKRAF